HPGRAGNRSTTRSTWRSGTYEVRRRRVRAAFRAASCVMPMRLRVAAPRLAATVGERLVPRRARADVLAWRLSEESDAAARPSPLSTRRMARPRFGDEARGFRNPCPASKAHAAESRVRTEV